ncbi:hypothetical protein MLD38_005060 [Melastoma candidum]|uniref:Uncharacterized protein n=1 Tax=Melastoma candidum TaxID=119954 RepID=A0ACB9S6W5_9MYRT|nr:hypothetical protein MLD38_005060 [Melastoma candidum]
MRMENVDSTTAPGFLLFMYPEANVPVCQLSIQTHRDGTYHYNLGRALAPLKDDGILIVGAGGTTHSHRDISRGDSVPTWARDFDSWVKDALLEGTYEDINHYEKAPGAKLAHPTPEHFYPLHVALGAAGENVVAKQIHHSWTKENLTKASYQFTQMD